MTNEHKNSSESHLSAKKIQRHPSKIMRGISIHGFRGFELLD